MDELGDPSNLERLYFARWLGSSARHSPFTPSRCKGSSDKTSDYAAPIEHSACLTLLVSKADVADQAHDGPLTRALEKLYKRKFIPV